MEYIKGEDVNQYHIVCYDNMVDKNSIVRTIKLFAKLLYSIQPTKPRKKTGRKSYCPIDLLGLYIYGYYRGITSCRNLSDETKINIELIWLLGGLNPCPKTVSNFKNKNQNLIDKAYETFLYILREGDLLDLSLVAVDGSFFSAVNHNSMNTTISKQNNIEKKNNKKIEKIKASLNDLNQKVQKNCDQKNDSNSEVKKIEKLEVKLQKAEKKRELALQKKKEIKSTGTTQISYTDKDSRMMTKTGSKTDVSYNVQTCVDRKHKFIVGFEVTNHCNDNKLSYKMLNKVKSFYNLTTLNGTLDKGYYNQEQLHYCYINNITTFLPIPDQKIDYSNPYNRTKFLYDEEKNVMICPNKKELPFRYFDKKKKQNHYGNRKVCEGCSSFSKCITSKDKFKRICRSEYDYVYEHQRSLNKKNKEKLNERKSIVEHPFGTIKQHVKINGFQTKGLKSVNSEFSLIALGYNLKRANNILGFKGLSDLIKKYFRDKVKSSTKITFFFISNFKRRFYFKNQAKIA